jgi:glutathione S-transferase
LAHDEALLVATFAFVFSAVADGGNRAALRAGADGYFHRRAEGTEFLAINPMAKVPALKDGEATLAEAAAICAYVAERYPEAKLAPPLGDPLRAKYLYWLFFAPSCIEPAMMQIATKVEINPVAAGWGEAQRVFDVLDATLTKGPWILGEAFSAADIAIGSGLNFAVRQFKMVSSRPSFDRYIDRCAARPAFQRAGAIAAG